MFRIYLVVLAGFFLSISSCFAQRRSVKPKQNTSKQQQTIQFKDSSSDGENPDQSNVFEDDTISSKRAQKKSAKQKPSALQPPTSAHITEQQAEDNLARQPKTVFDSVYAYRIVAEDISWLSVCPGTTINIPYTTFGPFDDDNVFAAHLIDANGKSVPISLPVKKGVIRAVIPSYKPGGEVYRVQIISTIPIIKSQEVPIRLLQAPSARLEATDGTQSVRIMPGQQAQLRVNFTGAAPWSFRLSDSSLVHQTSSTPYYLTVKPSQVQAYKLLGVANACGSGTMSGEVIINVDDNPEPKLELKEIDKITKVCTGIPFQVPFAATGKFRPGNQFTVQIADRTGSYRTISAPDTSGNLVTQIPTSYRPGEYKLRVTSSAPYLVSQPANISIAATTVAVLQKDSLHLEENGSGALNVKFEGAGPWFILLSDGTYENNIMESPYKVRIKPFANTEYQITSAGGLCGVGKFSGKAKVSVDTPPVAITLEKLPQNMVCAGTSIDIPYKIVGRFNPGNKFVVQITDKTGRFVDMPTSVTATVMKVKLPGATQTDTIRTHRIRILSSSPAVASVIEELDVIAPDKAIGEVSGKGSITAGRSTRIQLKFKNGLPPWSFTLSDGTAITGTFLNPYLISVSPKQTTTYTISSLKSGCGSGQGKGSAFIAVDK